VDTQQADERPDAHGGQISRLAGAVRRVDMPECPIDFAPLLR
jgi:hypothetical protein